jgi:predicted nucleic acid-binding protein
MSSIVFDATALIHFSRAGRLRELQVSSTEDEAILLVNVSKELEQGGPLRPTLDPATVAWLKAADLTEMTELAAFARYRTELGGRAERNNGEAAVLAWISINGGTAIIDEEVARNIGQDDGLAVHGSLWLLARSFNDGILDRATTEGTISDLLSSGMRLPCKNGTDFIPWAQSVGLIPQN